MVNVKRIANSVDEVPRTEVSNVVRFRVRGKGSALACLADRQMVKRRQLEAARRREDIAKRCSMKRGEVDECRNHAQEIIKEGNRSVSTYRSPTEADIWG